MNDKQLKTFFSISLQLTILALILIILNILQLIQLTSRASLLLPTIPIIMLTISTHLKYKNNKQQLNKIIFYTSLLSLIPILIIYAINNPLYSPLKSLFSYILIASISLAILNQSNPKPTPKLTSKPTSKPTPKPTSQQNSIIHYIPLLIILILSAFLYIQHIPTIKYIDTDEARLFFDAYQISEGKIPFKDFQARSPLLIYTLSIITSSLPNTETTFYYLNILANLATITLIYILTKQLSNTKTATIASLIFALSPIITFLLWTKTQTYQIPLILLSFILFNQGQKRNNKTLTTISLIIYAAAFFIRESTAAYILGFFPLIFLHNKDPEIRYKKSINLITIYFAIIVFYVLTNATFFTYENYTLNSKITKLDGLELDESSIARLEHLPYYISTFYITLSLSVIAIITTLILKLKPIITTPKDIFKIPSHLSPMIYPTLLLAGLTAIYTFNAYRLGFWPQYFMEFIPYFSILIAIGITSLLNTQKIPYQILIILFLIPTILLSNTQGIIYMKEYKGAINREIAIEASQYIQQHTTKDQTIFAGSPIYAYLAQRSQPLNLSHEYYTEEIIQKTIKEIQAHPPQIIINDGRIKDYYLKDETFKLFLQQNYNLTQTYQKEAYNRTSTVEIYELIN